MHDATRAGVTNGGTQAMESIVGSGLEDVVAATTRLSDVDGLQGQLVIAGYAVEDLAGHVTFEDAVFLLWNGRLPTSEEGHVIQGELGQARQRAFEKIGGLGDALTASDPMDALRAGMSHLSTSKLEEHDARSAALFVIGAMAVIAAAAANPDAPVPPDPEASHAADYLRMVRGSAPSPAEVAALDAYLVTVIDHGMNASTFAARVVGSTASDLVSAIVAGIGALKGKLHGGAPGPVLDMLDAIGDEARAPAWIEAALARKERVMGMGHRVYRVRDPRAFVLERALTRLETERGTPDSAAAARLKFARAVEREAEAILALRYPERPIRANVEFYTAVLLEAIGLPRPLFTPTFGVGRVAGWCAHVLEHRRHGRLIRPKSRYTARAPSSA